MFGIIKSFAHFLKQGVIFPFKVSLFVFYCHTLLPDLSSPSFPRASNSKPVKEKVNAPRVRDSRWKKSGVNFYCAQLLFAAIIKTIFFIFVEGP